LWRRAVSAAPEKSGTYWAALAATVNPQTPRSTRSNLPRLIFDLAMLAAQERTIAELRKALEKAGIEFIAENGGGAGVMRR
jgi:hypothetical protein